MFSDFKEFYQFVTGKVNRQQLLTTNKVSRPTLSVKFRIFFNKPLSCQSVWQALPPRLTNQTTKESGWVYGVDGKWLKRQGVFIIHRDITHRENIFWSYLPSESYAAFHDDLTKLTRLLGESKSSYPQGAISDWKGAIVAAVASHFGNIPHQRCLTHVVRNAKRLLPKASPFKVTLVLRNIANQLTNIKTEEGRRNWLKSLIKWEKEYGYLLKEKTYGFETQKKWWYTHGNLRRGWRLLTDDWQPFFIHHDYPFIPHSNNSLEGTISQAKNKLIDHRGMKIIQQVSFLSWYFTFSRVKTKQDFKKLWVVWKEEE